MSVWYLEKCALKKPMVRGQDEGKAMSALWLKIPWLGFVCGEGC